MESIQFLLQQSLQQQINALAQKPDKSSPTGSVIAFAGSVAPTGWLFCDGSSKSSTTYPELYAVIGTTYGGGGGNFNLPSLAEKFVKGATPDTLATTGGGTITIEADNLPQHSHTLNSSNAPIASTAVDHAHSIANALQQSGAGVGWGNQGNITGSAITSTGLTSLTITSTISGVTEESTAPSVPNIPVVPSFLALHYIIYAGK